MKNISYDKFNMHLFWYWVTERKNIWWRRNIEKIPPPWTSDEILRTYKFTNVERELDKTTIWYHDNIGTLPTEKDVIFGTFTHRLFNKIETMEMLLPYMQVKTFNHKKVTKLLMDKRSKGFNVFTSAHLTTGVRFAGSPDKLVNILYLVDLIHKDIDNVYESIKTSESMEDLYNRTRKVNGFGPFLGFQFILDMINCRICNFDHDDFVMWGPGAKRGVRLIFPDTSIGFEEGLRFLRDNQHYFFDKYGYGYMFSKELGGKERGIHLGNIENCSCEFSKFYKAYTGTGRPRNRYIATTQLEMF